MELGIKPINCEHGTIETNDGKAELLFTQDPKRPVSYCTNDFTFSVFTSVTFNRKCIK